MCLRGSSTPPLFLKNRSSCSNYRVGGLRLSVQTLCAHVCMCLNMANMCVCECLLNQNLQSWIYSGTFPGALRARNQKFPLIVVYSYAWIYTTSFARKYQASLLTKKNKKKKLSSTPHDAQHGEKKSYHVCSALICLYLTLWKHRERLANELIRESFSTWKFVTRHLGNGVCRSFLTWIYLKKYK